MFRSSSKALVVRMFVALAVAGFMVGTLAAVDREDEITKTVARVKDSAVAITQVMPNDSGIEIGSPIGGGTIIDARHGMVLTCQHVVDGADVFGILMSDGTELVGYKVFEDAATDLAVLEIRRPGSHKLKEVRLASSSDLILGERTIVIGSPRGKDHTVTFGRISNLSRDVEFGDGSVIKDMVQTDAAINPGNSGGPAFNVNGEYMGTVNSVTRGAYGLSYFIKADVADRVLSERMSITARKKIVHGVTAQVKVQKKEGKDRHQLVVEKVTGPAEAAGLKPKDVIVKVGGLDIRNRFDLERSMWDNKADDKVTVTVLRDGKQFDVSLKLAKWTAPKGLDKAVGELGGLFSPFIMRLLPEKK